MSYNKLNENQPPSYQATASLQGPPPKYESAYPPQGTYPAAQQTNVITNQQMILIQNGLGPYSKVITCPNCQALVSTILDYEPGLLTWLVFGLICITGGWLGCCLIPFCNSGTLDVKHSCPSCGIFFGLYKRI